MTDEVEAYQKWATERNKRISEKWKGVGQGDDDDDWARCETMKNASKLAD